MIQSTNYFILTIVAVFSVISPSLAVEIDNSPVDQTEVKKMGAQIGVVSYDFVKSLPNHPEILLIDVREPEEIQELGKIPTSINIPLATVQTELGETVTPEAFKEKYSRDKPTADSPIIFSCRSGRRSQKASEYAVALGYTNVKNYKGSWNDWAEHEGLPH